jgi:hypothetical protein
LVSKATAPAERIEQLEAEIARRREVLALANVILCQCITAGRCFCCT